MKTMYYALTVELACEPSTPRATQRLFLRAAHGVFEALYVSHESKPQSHYHLLGVAQGEPEVERMFRRLGARHRYVQPLEESRVPFYYDYMFACPPSAPMGQFGMFAYRRVFGSS